MALFSRCWCCPRIPWGVPWCSPSQRALGWTEPRQPLHHWCGLTHSCRWWAGGQSDLRPGPKQMSINRLRQVGSSGSFCNTHKWIRTYRAFSLDILNEGQPSAAWSVLTGLFIPPTKYNLGSVSNLCCWRNQARANGSFLRCCNYWPFLQHV